MTGAPIFVAFVLLDALVLWLLIASRGKWFYKLAAIVVTVLFNFAVWGALGSFKGWPTHESAPSKAFFISALIDQPSEVTHDAGHIDLWLIPFSTKKVPLGYSPSQYEPRAYREPFSRSLERAVIRAIALQKGNGGQPVVLAQGTKKTGRRNRGTGTPGHVIPQKNFRSYNLPKQVPLTKRGHS